MMPDGGVLDENIVLNDITLCSGSPQDAYNYGAYKRLPEVRQLLLEGKNDEAQTIINKDFICRGAGSGKENRGHRPRRQTLKARRQRARGERGRSYGLAVEHRHARLPAFVVHHVPSVVGAGARLEDPLLVRVGGVDDGTARRAEEACLERCPAYGVAQRFDIVRTASSPVGEQPERRGECAPIGRELVREACRALLVGSRAQDPGALQATQTVREDVRRDPREGVAEITEPARSIEHRLDEQQAPAIADALERRLERERSSVGRGGVGRA